MGMDTVELVMLWEDSLGVELRDVDAASMRTPNDVVGYFAGKLGATDSNAGICLGMRAFYRIRAALVTETGATRSAIRPSSRVRDVVPKVGRREGWQKVRTSASLRLLPGYWGIFGLFSGSTTFACLAASLVAAGASTLKYQAEQWTRAEVRQAVRAGVTEMTGLREFSDDASFIEDLGLD